MLLGKLKSLFAQDADPDPSARARALQLAAAAALLEVSYADFEISADELEQIARTLSRRFQLTPDEGQELLAAALEEHEQRTSLHECVALLNAQLDAEGKRELMRSLWQVAWADGSINKFEEHRMRRLAGLLHVPHSEFIRARYLAETPDNS